MWLGKLFTIFKKEKLKPSKRALLFSGLEIENEKQNVLIINIKHKQTFVILTQEKKDFEDWEIAGTFNYEELIDEFKDNPSILKELKKQYHEYSQHSNEIVI